MNILSVHSHVSFGHVGNSAVAFALQRLGAEVWPVNTVAFSNHPGHGGFAGRVAEPAEIAALIGGIERLGELRRCDALLSGYLGEPGNGAVVLDAVAALRRANPRALYCCDPVIGDEGPGLYVRPGLPEFMRDRAIPAADIVTPNSFELAYLAGHPIVTRADLTRALAMLHRRGPKTILVTSLRLDEAPADAMEVAASDGRAVYRVRTPRIDRAFNGAGDALAAMFLLHLLRGRALPEALASCVASTFAVLARTASLGVRELALIAAQDELVAPDRTFPVELVAGLA